MRITGITLVSLLGAISGPTGLVAQNTTAAIAANATAIAPGVTAGSVASPEGPGKPATEAGTIYAHTVRGLPSLIAAGGNGTAQTIFRGMTFAASGQAIKAPEGMPLVLVLSNGATIALPAGGEMTIEEFTQEPVNDSGKSREYEPSRSKIRLKLLHGTLVICTRNPRPTSTITLSTPLGELSCSARSLALVVEATTEVLNLGVIEGTVNLTVPQTGFTDILQTGQYGALSRATMNQPRPITTSRITTTQDLQFQGWKEMGRWAESRVNFVRQGDSLRAQLVVPLDFTRQYSADDPTYR